MTAVTYPRNLPAVDPEGAVIAHAGKHARNAVLTAFEMLGGTRGLAEWATRTAVNESDFYTKIFPKVIQKEVELTDRRSIEDVLSAIDGEFTVVDNPAPAVAAPDMQGFDGLGAIVVGDVDVYEDAGDE